MPEIAVVLADLHLLHVRLRRRHGLREREKAIGGRRRANRKRGNHSHVFEWFCLLSFLAETFSNSSRGRLYSIGVVIISKQVTRKTRLAFPRNNFLFRVLRIKKVHVFSMKPMSHRQFSS